MGARRPRAGFGRSGCRGVLAQHDAQPLQRKRLDAGELQPHAPIGFVHRLRPAPDLHARKHATEAQPSSEMSSRSSG